MKLCSRCEIEKSDDAFNKRYGKLQSYCRECNKSYHKHHYEANKSSYIEDAKIRNREQRKWFEQYKATLQCSKCDENHPAVLEFHHKDPDEKDFNISWAVDNLGKQKILEEVKKCVVLCSNCHKKIHWLLNKVR